MPRPERCAIIPTQNEASSIENVMRQLHRAKVGWCIVIANGCTDQTVSIAERAAKLLFRRADVVSFTEPLGPDVARAIGAYAGLRRFSSADQFLFVDSDWQGSFGPALDDFSRYAETEKPDVLFVGSALLPTETESTAFRAVTSSTPFEPKQARLDRHWWNLALAWRFPLYTGAAPAELPMLVNRRAFDHVSPYYLHHPGLWFALCMRAMEKGLKVSVYNHWNPRILGNPSRSREHSRRMAMTLMGDALEGGCVLLGLKPTREWNGVFQDGYHTSRRLDILGEWRAQVEHGD